MPSKKKSTKTKAENCKKARQARKLTSSCSESTEAPTVQSTLDVAEIHAPPIPLPESVIAPCLQSTLDVAATNASPIPLSELTTPPSLQPTLDVAEIHAPPVPLSEPSLHSTLEITTSHAPIEPLSRLGPTLVHVATYIHTCIPEHIQTCTRSRSGR